MRRPGRPGTRHVLTHAEKCAYRATWKVTPRPCACGRRGIHPEAGGQNWICAACWQIEQNNQAAGLKRSRPAHVNAPIYDEYRLHLDAGSGMTRKYFTTG